MLSKDIKTKVDTLYKSIKNNDEFEVMYNNYKSDNKLSLVNFMKMLKYMKYRSVKDKLKILETQMLDIIYQDEKNNFRVSIDEQNNINDFLSFVHLRKNNKILNILSDQYVNKDNFTFIKKIKDKSRIIDVDELDIRFRVSSEEPMNKEDLEKLKKVPISDSENVFFRFKQRLTLYISENLVLDLTIIKSSNNINKINDENKAYELELEQVNNKNLDFELLLKECERIKKVLSDSNMIINNSNIMM